MLVADDFFRRFDDSFFMVEGRVAAGNCGSDGGADWDSDGLRVISGGAVAGRIFAFRSLFALSTLSNAGSALFSAFGFSAFG